MVRLSMEVPCDRVFVSIPMAHPLSHAGRKNSFGRFAAITTARKPKTNRVRNRSSDGPSLSAAEDAVMTALSRAQRSPAR